MSVTGGCLCGAVRYSLNEKPKETGACYCDMCRKWSGGVFMAVHYAAKDVTLTGDENIGRYQSSEWAERCFCKTCGSTLFYHVTQEGPYYDNHHFGFGTLDDPNGIPMVSEMFIDKKPNGYAFAGETKKMTEAEVFAMFAPQDEDAP